MTVSLLALAFAYSVMAYVIVLVPFVMSTSLVNPVIVSFLTKTSDGSATGALLGVASSAESICKFFFSPSSSFGFTDLRWLNVGRVIAPLLCGLLLDLFFDGAPPIFGAGIALLCIGFIHLQYKKLKNFTFVESKEKDKED